MTIDDAKGILRPTHAPLMESLPCIVVDEPATIGQNANIVALADWVAGLIDLSLADEPQALALSGETPLGFIVSQARLEALDEPVIDLIESLHAPIWAPQSDIPLEQQILNHISQFAIRQMKEASDLRAAAAELRRQHSDMQSRFYQFENFIYDCLAPKYVLHHTWKATDQSIELSDQALRQALPIPSQALAAIDISVVDITGEGGDLVLTVERAVGGAIAEPVAINLYPEYRGWARFHFAKALDGLPEDMVAKFEYRGAGSVRLTTSIASPIAKFQLQSGDQTQPSPLAIRVFKGLPGAKLPGTHSPRVAPPLDNKPRLFSAFDVSPAELLPEAPNVIVERNAADFYNVEYWQDQNAFMVHPSIHFPVVGIAKGLMASRMTRMTSTIQIARHDTDTIAFAIGAAPMGKVTNSDEALDFLGPWRVLNPGDWGVCEKMFEVPIEGPFDLLMATSMEGHGSNENGWAMFRDFWITNSRQST